MHISFNAENITFPDLNKKKMSKWIEIIAGNYGKIVGEISYLFSDDDKILELNKHYLQHDFYTDIITFDYSENEIISGDIIISLDTVLSNSQMYNTNFNEELHRVIIHGILHLCGINDKSKEDEDNMRKAENKAITILKEL